MKTEKTLPEKLRKTIDVSLSEITKADNGFMRAIITAEIPDADGDIVVVDGITWGRYNEANPLPVLSSHLRKLPDGKPPQVGFSPRLIKTKTVIDGEAVPVVVMEWQWLDTELAKEWQEVATKTGRLSFSIGAIVHAGEPIENDGMIEGFRFTSTELTEVSVVTIPANPTALSIKTATETTEVKEEQINNQFDKINELLSKLASSCDALEARLDEIATADQTVTTPIEIDEANGTKAQSDNDHSEKLQQILDKIKTIKTNKPNGEPLNGDQRDTKQSL